jgi:hypothetical protein
MSLLLLQLVPLSLPILMIAAAFAVIPAVTSDFDTAVTAGVTAMVIIDRIFANKTANINTNFILFTVRCQYNQKIKYITHFWKKVSKTVAKPKIPKYLHQS